MNPLQQLEATGQAVWLDYLSRSLIASGELARLIDEDGLKGLTSNPSIFEKAIGEGDDYDRRRCSNSQARATTAPTTLYEHLAIADIQAAADVLRPVYDRTKRPRRLRQPGGLALSRQRHRRHASPRRGGCGRRSTGPT